MISGDFRNVFCYLNERPSSVGLFSVCLMRKTACLKSYLWTVVVCNAKLGLIFLCHAVEQQYNKLTRYIQYTVLSLFIFVVYCVD